MQQQQSSQEGYYVSPNFSKTITTHAGNICDYSGSQNIGLWDPLTMTNLSFVPNAVTLGTFIQINAIPGGKGNRVVAYSADRFSLIDFDLPNGQRVLWEKTETIDDIYQIATSTTIENEIYVLMTSGELKIWDITKKAVIQSIKLIRKMYSKIQVFPGSKYFLVEQKQGYEFSMIERSTGLQQNIHLKSASLHYLILSEIYFAVILKNFLVVYDASKGPGTIAKVLQCEDHNEVIETAALLNNEKWVAVAGEKGILTVFDIATLQQIRYIDLNAARIGLPAIQHIQAILYLPKTHQIAIVDKEKRNYCSFSLAPFDAAPNDFSNSFKLEKTFDASLKSYDTCLKITDKYAVAIASYGFFSSDEIIFMNEVQVIDINNHSLVACKTLHLPKFSLISKSIHVDSQAGILFYTMRNDDTDEGVFLKLDVQKLVECSNNKVDTDSALTAQPFSVQQKGKHAIFLPSDSDIQRIIVPFNVKLQKGLPVGFGTFQESCGLAVYDFNVKQLWIHQFDSKVDFIVKHATMIDKDHVAFVDVNSVVQVWDIVSDKQVSSNKLEHTISLMECFDNRLLILDEKNVAHFYESDSFDSICDIQLKQNESIKSIAATGDDNGNYYVVYGNEKLARISTDSESVTEVKSLKHDVQKVLLFSNSGESVRDNAFIIKDEFILFKKVSTL